MLKPIAVWNPEKEIWEKENPSSSKQWVLFSATFPTSGMMRGGKLFPLPQSVPPTAETESSSTPIPEECFHTPDTAPDAPNKGSNTRSKPAGLGNQVKELPIPEQTEKLPMLSGELKVKLLPTPRVSDSKGVDNETEWARHSPGLAAMSFHLRSDDDVVNLLVPDNAPLLPTSTVGAREVRNSPGEMARTSPALGAVIADLAENGDRSQFFDTIPVLPTPVTQDGNGHMQDMSADVGNNGRSVSLGDVVSRLPDGEGRGKYEPAVRRWEKLTRPAPIPTEPNKNGNPRLAAPFSEWMMGWPEGWVTDPEIGLPRTAQLKIIGNGVCPQQAYSAITELLSIHASEEKMIQ